LFNENSKYNFSNIQLNNISTNSKALFSFSNKETIINDIDVNDIKLIGEDSSLIYMDDSDFHKNILINNLNIKDSISNGAFLKFCGSSNEIKLNNISFQSVRSHQPLIYNQSKKVRTILNNL